MLDIARLKIQDPVEGEFLVAEKTLSRTKDGRPFLRLTLMNRTGSIEATIWENTDEASLVCERGRIVRVTGRVTSYQNEIKINLKSVSPADEARIDPSEFLPSSSKSHDEMTEELFRTIRGLTNPFLRRLLETIFRDPETMERFIRVPAAKSMHHAFLGGLCEHSLSLAAMARVVAKQYPFLDSDLLAAAALLHDIGKAWEISPELGFGYTDEGRLLGHVHIGMNLIERRIAAIPEFPPGLALHIKHIVGSHHGELEFGAITLPMTLEAVCLNQLDNLDAKLQAIREFTEREKSDSQEWSPFHRLLQRYFYLPESDRPNTKSRESKKRGPSKGMPPDLFES